LNEEHDRRVGGVCAAQRNVPRAAATHDVLEGIATVGSLIDRWLDLPAKSLCRGRTWYLLRRYTIAAKVAPARTTTTHTLLLLAAQASNRTRTT